MNIENIHITSNPEVELVFKNYPKSVRNKMLILRQLVIETANEMDGLNTLEETLKWGEPSYLTTNGSTLRMDWKLKTPHQYAMYFKCSSRLVKTFRVIFKNKFHFEGNRAIVFKLDDKIPKDELKSCIKAALNYHKIKHLPTLGMD